MGMCEVKGLLGCSIFLECWMMFKSVAVRSLEGTELKVLTLKDSEACQSWAHSSYHGNIFLTSTIENVKSPDSE